MFVSKRPAQVAVAASGIPAHWRRPCAAYRMSCFRADCGNPRRTWRLPAAGACTAAGNSPTCDRWHPEHNALTSGARRTSIGLLSVPWTEWQVMTTRPVFGVPAGDASHRRALVEMTGKAQAILRAGLQLCGIADVGGRQRIGVLASRPVARFAGEPRPAPALVCVERECGVLFEGCWRSRHDMRRTSPTPQIRGSAAYGGPRERKTTAAGAARLTIGEGSESSHGLYRRRMRRPKRGKRRRLSPS